MKKIYIILFILGAFGCFSSCELEDRSYNGPLYVEFCPDQYGQIAAPSGIEKIPSAVGADTIGVQLIGLAKQNPITVNFRIVDQVFYLISLDRYVVDLPAGTNQNDYQTILATGKYNVDYSFDGLSGVTFDQSFGRGSFTIPPNSQFGIIPINILQKSGAKLFFVLEDSPDIKVNKPTSLLRYNMIDKVVLLDESFATDPFAAGANSGWTEIDKDGDGYTWNWYDGAITSDSWTSNGRVPLTPENYLISPAITIPAEAPNVTLEFQVAAADDTDFREQYKVIISENPITFDNCRDADVIQDWTELTAANSDGNFSTVSFDITAYKGKTVYIGIVHGNCTNQYYIMIRNLSVYTH